jgi:hypothetical protein
MKAKILTLLAAACLLTSAAWFVQAQRNRLEGEVPEKYRGTVDKGLEFLVKNQFADGHWEGDAGKHPVATTALAAMCLLMDGGRTAKSKYADIVRKASDWLLDKCQAGRDGLIYSGHPSETEHYMSGHGFATQFLAWNCRDERDPERRKKLYEAVSRAVAYIAKAQSTTGGWYRTSKIEGHDFALVGVTAIQLQALQIALDAGLPVSGGAMVDAQEYLKTEIESLKDEVGPSDPRKTADLAAALSCRTYPAAYLNQDGVGLAWYRRCRTEIPLGRKITFGRDEMMHYHYALAIFNKWLETEATDADWFDYRPRIFDQLQMSQKKDGSWPAPVDADGSISVGPVYATALWCTILQLDKKCHPQTREPLRATF